MPSCYICRKSNECYEMKEMKCRLHLFPVKQPSRVKKWIEFARVPEGVDVSKLHLCTKHFVEKDVRRHPFYVMLQKEAIPTLFPPTGDGRVPTAQKLGAPLRIFLKPEIILEESEAAWDPGSPEESVSEDHILNEDSEPSYDEEVLKKVKDQLCRVCGMKRENLLPIFSTAEAFEDDVVTLSKKIQLYLPLEIDIEDGLPPNICLECRTQVDSWHEMHTTSVAADSLLRSMFTTHTKEVILQKTNEEARSDIENLSEDQVQDGDTKTNCNTQLTKSMDMETSSDIPLDNHDKEEGISLHLENNSDLFELEIREFVKRIEEKLQGDDSVVEMKQIQPDCIKNDHMYARGEPVPTTYKFCRHRLSCKLLGENVIKLANEGGLTCTCMGNKKGSRNHNVLKKFRELLGKLEEKIVEECSTVNGERMNDVEKPLLCQNNEVNEEDKKSLLPIYTCVHCRQVFSHRKTGIVHKKQCALEPAMCEICGRILKTRKELKDHRARHSRGKRTSCICEKCGKIFITKAGLKAHMKNVHTEETFICEPCCKVFTTKARLGVHMKQHESGKVESLNIVITESGQEGVFICPVCRAQFHDKISVIVHMNERMKIRCLKCKGWILSERLSLAHKCAFTTCRFCSKRFLRTGGRYAHERLHTGEKPYTCKECGKAFASCATLINHRVTHKPPEYKCEICNKWFLRKTVYKDHMGFHAGIKHPCKFCSNIYNSRLALNKHNAKKHRDRMKSASNQDEYFVIEDFL